jgi:hypothetical protein
MPLCLNIKLDTVFFDGEGRRFSEFELFRWLDYVSTNIPDVYSSIRMLELRNTGKGRSPIPRYSADWYRRRFPSLETLCITLQRPFRDYSNDEIKEILQEAKEWLAEEQYLSSGCRRNIKVIVRRWQELSVGALALEEI